MNQFTELENIIRSRHSVRAFRSDPVAKDLIERILATASYAPSATNTQPWQVYVVQGKVRDEIVKRTCASYDEEIANPEQSKYSFDANYYPEKWFSPYQERRRQIGWQLYGLLGIKREDKAAMIAQQRRNFVFFGAPVGLFFTIHRDLGIGSVIDIAMMMDNIMLLAKAYGLDSCPQAAWNKYHSFILPLLGASVEEKLLAAICLGYADEDHIVNTLVTPRERPDQFTRWLGFDK